MNNESYHSFYYQLRKGHRNYTGQFQLFKTLRHFHSQRFLHPANFYLNFQTEMGTVHYILALFPTIILHKGRERIGNLRRIFLLACKGFP